MLDEHHGWPGVIESISFGWNSKERERDYLEFHFFFPPLYLHGMDSSVSPKEACQECSGSPHLILIKKLGRWVFFTKGRIFLVFGFVDHGLVGNPSIRGLIDGQ